MKFFKKIFNLIYTYYMKTKGYSDYYISFYDKEFKNGYKQSNLPIKEKKWAYERGFYPWRIEQYNLNEDNYKQIISDKDYYYLFPINNRYSKWVDDKLTMKYVYRPFDRFLPQYYYHLMNERSIMKLMDCPISLGNKIDDVLLLLQEKLVLAAKMSAGTYGIGFYKLEFDDGKYIANGKSYTKDEYKSFLFSLNDYIITEFVEMHPDIKKLNPLSVNTIRVVVINEHGDDPIIPFAFMRIGTKKSGIVDNVAQGGMVCKIDVSTGKFYDGEFLSNHVYQKIDFHPDTNEILEGNIPNWEIVMSTLIKMSEYCPQLKWLGYDIAITGDGFKIIEINSHQGLHKAHEYPKAVNDFLFSELSKKKKKYCTK